MIRLFKSIRNYPMVEEALHGHFDFVGEAAEADLIISDSSEDFRDHVLSILVSPTANGSNDVIVIDPSMDASSICRTVEAIIRTAELIPQTQKLASLREQNLMLSEANKGLIDLYKVIEQKNDQIGYLKNKLEGILNSAGESILEIDASGRILFANLKFMNVTGYGRDRWVSMNLFDIFTLEGGGSARALLTSDLADTSTKITGDLVTAAGETIQISGYLTVVIDRHMHFEFIFEDITSWLRMERQMKKLEEKAIVAGFSRHLSHNILNALTTAAGFLRQVKQDSDTSDNRKFIWRIIEEKMRLIEEIVTGYNDYTNAISLRTNTELELKEYFEQTVGDVANKTFDKAFSAFLYQFLDRYEITTSFDHEKPVVILANPMFLKLAFCYIIKDTIRFFEDRHLLSYHVRTGLSGGRYAVFIDVLDVDVPEHIMDTMMQPWNHQMLSQSFDYWGVVIAHTVMERHGGFLQVARRPSGLQLVMQF